MDCLATSSAAASLIEQDEPAKPSSLQCPRRAVALSDPSERDRASGTLGNISLDDDEEAITTDDEYYDTRSETSSISSLRALESSFYQMPSASRHRASGTLGNIPLDDDEEAIMTDDEYYDARSETCSISSLRARKSSFYQIPSASRHRASGTLGNIPLDDDEEAIMTDDEYYDAPSETSSISSLRALESSFYQIASASRESLDSFLSILAPSLFETRKMNIRELAEYLQSKHRLSKTVILDMTTYHSPSVIFIKHMFVVLRVKQGHLEGWLRLDRRAEDPFSVSFLFSGMRGPAKDEVCHILFS